MVWAGASATDVEAIADARQRAIVAGEDEYRRLLYVALTRAANRLIICGTEGRTMRPEGCWYDLVFDALSGHANFVEEPAEDGEGKVWKYQPLLSSKPPAPTAESASNRQPVLVPDWLCRDAAAEPAPAAAVSPSAAVDDRTSPRASKIDGQDVQEHRHARARGILVHRLMQALPDILPERRMEAGQKYLTRAADEFSATELQTILDLVLGLIADHRFAPLFAPGSRAEVPIIGRLPRGALPPLVVSGQIDRLAITEEAVLVADYKTNRPAPRCLAEVPPAYVTQLALYRAVLGRVFPDRTIRAALIWTDVPDLMELSAADLERALIPLMRREKPRPEMP